MTGQALLVSLGVFDLLGPMHTLVKLVLGICVANDALIYIKEFHPVLIHFFRIGVNLPFAHILMAVLARPLAVH
jgi:hypothetical protein